MFLRGNKRTKDGKEHRYFTVVESRRLSSGRVAQKQVLYLGEINDSQQAAWRKTLEVFDEDQGSWNERGPTATAGWDASCGGTCNWISFGNVNYPRAVRL